MVERLVANEEAPGSTPGTRTKMNLGDHKNPRKQGDAGLGAAIGYFASIGATVCVPLTDSQDYDLIVDYGGGLKRVQVKTTTHFVNGAYEVGLRTNGGNRSGTGKTKKFDSTRVDLLFVLTASDDRYLIPSVSVGGTAEITLRRGAKYEEFILGC